MTAEALSGAIFALRNVLGDEYVFGREEAQSRYGSSMFGETERAILAALLPATAEEIIAIVNIARQYGLSLYPISKGKNWGYGSASPVADCCVVVDLSRMNEITQFDEELGLVKIEPGVTFGELEKFLHKKRSCFVAPLNGVGPDTSLVGNVLEKGFGSGTRGNTDRFATLMSLEAVLADGTRYASSNLLGRGTLPYYKWGVGPYIDGLFAQSNLGIVISATFSLSRRPESASAFFFHVKNGVSPGELTEKIREVSEELGDTLSSLIVENADRLLFQFFQHERPPQNNPDLSGKAFAEDWLKRRAIPEWVVLGSLQGKKAMVRAAEKIMRRRFSSCAEHVWTFRRGQVPALLFLRTFLPRQWRRRSYFLFMVHHQMENILGNFDSSREKNPQSGMVFFVAALPMKKDIVENFVKRAKKICTAKNFRMPLRLLKLTEKAYHISLPIVFDKNNAKEAVMAKECFEELYAMAREEDVLPYRVGINAMRLLFATDKPFWKTAEKIKQALDPENIISPGRYSSYKRPDINE